MFRLMFSRARALSVLTTIVVTATFGLFASSAQAAFYGNFSSGTGNVSFLNVQDVNGLFGTPIASGNSLDFTPGLFEVGCPVTGCPPATASIADTVTFQIDANTGFGIEDIILNESGDTSILDFGIPTGFAATTVVANVFIDILEVNGVPVSGINANTSMVFTADGSYETNVEGSGDYLWSGLLNLDVDAIIAAEGSQTGSATLVEISVANTLTAYAENGAQAFIEKKDFDGLAITVVPEPGTALLVGLGLAGLSSATRRFRA